MEKKFLITAEYGIHARPATRLVNKAMTFQAEIFMIAMDKTVNLKSIMGVMSLGVYKNEEVTITAEGVDAEKALEEISDFLLTEGLGRVI